MPLPFSSHINNRSYTFYVIGKLVKAKKKKRLTMDTHIVKKIHYLNFLGDNFR